MIIITVDNEEDREAVLEAFHDQDHPLFGGGATFRVEYDHGDHRSTIAGRTMNTVVTFDGGSWSGRHSDMGGGGGTGVTTNKPIVGNPG